MISVMDALAIIARNTFPRGEEQIPLQEALRRVLARDVVSDTDWPPFETSAMDGYAVRMADVSLPGAALDERAEPVAAGGALPSPLSPGEAVRVMTGAPLPKGTEAVIPVERTQREEGRVRFDIAPAPGAHLRRRGESIREGARIVSAGRRVTPGDVALAALAGADTLTVFSRPRVAIAATGNELVPAAEKPRPGQIRDSNGPMLASLCRAQGWAAAARRRVTDEAAGVAALFDSAGKEEDVLLTSGGVSAGDFDLLPGIARRQGFEILFHGVSVRPGKPVAFARRGATLWFGLPGNPVSSSVCFHVFVRYALGRLEGDPSPGAPRASARLARDLPPGGKRETYRDAILENAGGVAFVEPLTSAGSHDIATHARANALILVPAGAAPQPEGATVECLLL
ncbi:MAG TPA: gephyrin-like molybdotransferase Glp [Thermoanaerobaculia bacterium]|nr:gephyrin-like molybdotransferase Glp [Thermoanaerobaculia bacterium]